MNYYNNSNLMGFNPSTDRIVETLVENNHLIKTGKRKGEYVWEYQKVFENKKYKVFESILTHQRLYKEKV